MTLEKQFEAISNDSSAKNKTGLLFMLGDIGGGGFEIDKFWVCVTNPVVDAEVMVSLKSLQ